VQWLEYEGDRVSNRIELPFVSAVRSMESPRQVAIFFKSVAKDPNETKQKSYDYLSGHGSQPMKADFA
jgi:hypothetical protein